MTPINRERKGIELEGLRVHCRHRIAEGSYASSISRRDGTRSIKGRMPNTRDIAKQLEVVEEALAWRMPEPQMAKSASPNMRGYSALAALQKAPGTGGGITVTSLTRRIPCLVCGQQLRIRLAKGRKSQKTFLLLLSSQDRRHFRGFINDREYVYKVLARLERNRMRKSTLPSPGAPKLIWSGPARP